MRRRWVFAAIMIGLAFVGYVQIAKVTTAAVQDQGEPTVDANLSYTEVVAAHWDDIREQLLFLADHPGAFIDLLETLNENEPFREGFRGLHGTDFAAVWAVHGGTLPDWDPPHLLGVYLRKEHDISGEVGIPVPVDGTEVIDSRLHGGEFRIAFVFSDFVTAFDHEQDVSDSFSGNGTMTLSYSRNEVVCTITSQSSIVTAQLTGGVFGELIDVRICSRFGGVNGDGAVNLIDVGAAKSHTSEPLTDANCRFDVNVDGRVNSIDVLLVRSAAGGG